MPDERREAAFTVALGGAEKRREMLAHDTVNDGVRGGAPPVCVDAGGARHPRGPLPCRRITSRGNA